MASSYTFRFDREQMLDCARRERRMRENVYPGMVASGRMLQSTADYELHVMACIEGMLEEYPLKSVGATAVRVVIEELRKRGGFREWTAECRDWTGIEADIVRVAEKTIIYRDPLPQPKTMELNFEAPIAEQTSLDGPDFA